MLAGRLTLAAVPPRFGDICIRYANHKHTDAHIHRMSAVGVVSAEGGSLWSALAPESVPWGCDAMKAGMAWGNVNGGSG